MSGMTLKEARATLAEVVDDFDISIGATTRGQFGGDVLVLSLAFRPVEFEVRWPEGSWVKSPAEAARLIRGWAKRKRVSLSVAASQWSEARGHIPSSIADFAMVEPVGESARTLARWRTAESQVALVAAAAVEGVAVELGEYVTGDEGEDGQYRQLDAARVEVRGALVAGLLFEEYQRQVRAALVDGGAS